MKTTLTCKAKIHKEYKTQKAECYHPRQPGYDDTKYPLCLGEITIEVVPEDEPDYHSDHYAVIKIKVECSRCKYPFVYRLTDNTSGKEDLLTRALIQYLGGAVKNDKA